VKTLPVGLCGVFSSSRRARGPQAAARSAGSNDQRDDARHAAGEVDRRDVGVVEGFEEDDLVAGVDEGEHRVGQRLGRAGGDGDLRLGVGLAAVVARPGGGDGAAQAGRAVADGVLVEVGVDRGLRRLLDEVGAGEIGEALAEVDGVVLRRQPAHLAEDRGAQPRQPPRPARRHAHPLPALRHERHARSIAHARGAEQCGGSGGDAGSPASGS
jgi:hypothetical protein